MTTDFGLQVRSPSGDVIIDGSSSMFRIAAKGSHTLTVSAGNNSWKQTTLSALGSDYTTTPALLAMVAVDNLDPSTSRGAGTYIAPAATYAANVSGGATTTRFVGPPYIVQSGMTLDANPGTPVVQCGLVNEDTNDHTLYQYYFVLSEASF